jgi:hypothetical protein
MRPIPVLILHIKFSAASDRLRSLLARRATPATPESAKNASGQFGRKGEEVSVEQSPVVSPTDVTNPAIGAKVTATSVVEKDGASAAPPVGG